MGIRRLFSQILLGLPFFGAFWCKSRRSREKNWKLQFLGSSQPKNWNIKILPQNLAPNHLFIRKHWLPGVFQTGLTKSPPVTKFFQNGTEVSLSWHKHTGKISGLQVKPIRICATLKNGLISGSADQKVSFYFGSVLTHLKNFSRYDKIFSLNTQKSLPDHFWGWGIHFWALE